MVLSLKTVVAFALATVLLVTPRVARAADPPLDLERLTVSDLQQRIAAGELTSVQLTRAYINRIAAVNARGPGINAVRVVNPTALQDAAVLDPQRAARHLKGPPHRLPPPGQGKLDVPGPPAP